MTAKSIDEKILALEEQGYVRYSGVQLYWIMEIAQVSVPVAAEFVRASPNTLYRHMAADTDIKTSIHSRLDALMALLAMMVRDDVLPIKDEDGANDKLVGEQGVKVLNELIQPYLPHVVQRVVAADYLGDYVERYEAAKQSVGSRISSVASSPAQPDSTDASVHQVDEGHPEAPPPLPDSTRDQDSPTEALAADGVP